MRPIVELAIDWQFEYTQTHAANTHVSCDITQINQFPIDGKKIRMDKIELQR